MDGLDPGKRLSAILEKYKYALAVALIGILMMILPMQKEGNEPEPTHPQQVQQGLEQTLEQTLSQIQGAGNVKVLLTRRTGEEILYQTDVDENNDPESSSRNAKTVIVTDEKRSQTGLVRRTDPPEYLGALVVCQGGDNPQIRLAIVEAVSCVTGLSANKIAVLKMK